MDKDKLNITIRIAEVEPMVLEIKRHEEEAYRKAVDAVNSLYLSYKKNYGGSNEDTLAKVAFHYAKLKYLQLLRDSNLADKLSDAEEQIDTLLQDTND